MDQLEGCEVLSASWDACWSLASLSLRFTSCLLLSCDKVAMAAMWQRAQHRRQMVFPTYVISERFATPVAHPELAASVAPSASNR